MYFDVIFILEHYLYLYNIRLPVTIDCLCLYYLYDKIINTYIYVLLECSTNVENFDLVTFKDL